MLRNYFILLVAIGVFTSMLPSRQPMNSTPAASSEKSRKDRPDPQPASNAFSDGIELHREYNGHFYADAEINGSSVRVLVDTGASGIALSRSDAQRAGLAVSAGMFEVVGQGADGDVHGEHVMLDRVTLGSTTAERVPAVVLDAGEQSLLGQSFLSKFNSVEISGDTMILR